MGGRKESMIHLGIGGHAVILDAASGEEIRRTRVKRVGGTVTGVVAVDGRILVTASGELFCLDGPTGEPLWHAPLKGLGQGPVTLALGAGTGGRPLVHAGIGGHVVALSLDRGDEVWRRKLKTMAQFTGVVAAAAGLLASANGECWCLDPATGEVRWHNRLKGLGQGFVTFGGSDVTSAAAAELAAQQATIVAATVAATAATSVASG